MGFDGSMPCRGSEHVVWLHLCSPIGPDELVVRCAWLPHVLQTFFKRFCDGNDIAADALCQNINTKISLSLCII